MIKIVVILVIMALIDIALVFAIIRLIKRTDDNMQRFFLDKTSVYTPKQEEQPLQDDIKEESKNDTNIKTTPEYIINDTNNVEYKNTSFKKEYKDVKEEMSFDRNDVILDVIKNSNRNDNYLVSAIKRIKNDFNFNTVYELSTIEESKQLKVLKEVFDQEENKVLDNYLNDLGKKKFSVTDFFNYINEQVKLTDEKYYVKTGSTEENYDDLGKDVVTVYDEEIVEGIKVVHKNKLHDYSI